VLGGSVRGLLLVALFAAPAWAQAPAPQPAGQPSPAPPEAAAPATPAPAEPAPGAPAAEPGAEAVPFTVRNPYPTAPVLRGRLPPPRLYAVPPRPPPPPPKRYGSEGAPFSLGVGASFLYRDDVGYGRLGADNPQTELDLFASYDVLQVGSRLVIAAGIGYRFGGHGGENAVLVTSHAVSAELIARVKANWLAPHVRAGAGLFATRLQLQDPSADLELEDREQGALGVLGGGLTLRTPSRLFESHAGYLSSLSFGVLVEGGYILAGSATYQGKPDADGDLPQQSLALGSLDQGGGYVRVLGVVRF
jgi:hypothetical protein